MYGQMLTRETLPTAVANLFRLNNYKCEENVQIHGSQIDIVAKAKGDPFAPAIYIEVTVSRVDNDKYALDMTKFHVVQRDDPSCVCLSVSLQGFTAPVKERAKASGVRTQTYQELFQSFERFSAYIEKIITDRTIIDFSSTYEEPLFADDQGTDRATDWIAQWAQKESAEDNWIVVLGEYGTGKTALTRMIQLRMLQDYIKEEGRPLPIRIELKDFTRQFDARTLLHNFLDRHGLSHISIDFVFHLIRTRRVVLILDGYDEMAQFLNVRERRACLGALADLASEGARGILTSRPNYFSEEEELHVFEALYRNIQNSGYYISSSDQNYLDTERKVDQLLNKYILERFERHLRDLDTDQTISLVRRRLADDPAGQDVIIAILGKVFREKEPGVHSALSGKPVIITYLLELVESIKAGIDLSVEILTEWSVYKLIVDQLMLRDQQRTPGIYPTKRRVCLQRLAVILSQRDTPVAFDRMFHDIIEGEFKMELRFLEPDHAVVRRNELFENLRGSSTLTRTEGAKTYGWVFSHNSLREYLVSELYISSARDGKFAEISTPITQAMRAFVSAIDVEEFRTITHNLANVWSQRSEKRGMGAYLTLLWDGLCILALRDALPMRRVLPSSSGYLSLDDIVLKEVAFKRDGGSDYQNSLFVRSDLSEVTFRNVDLSGSSFSEGFLDSVIFNECVLLDSSFQKCWIYECDFTGCELAGADFRNLVEDPTIYVLLNNQRTALSGTEALGYLSFYGALVDSIDDYYVLRHHPKFDIIFKICEKLVEQRNRQELGLVQKGAARKDPPLAQEFLALLIKKSWAEYDRTMVAITAEGRGVIRDFIEHQQLPTEFAEFLRSK